MRLINGILGILKRSHKFFIVLIQISHALADGYNETLDFGRKLVYLRCNNCKALTCFTCPGGFNGSIQSQQIGLGRKGVDPVYFFLNV